MSRWEPDARRRLEEAAFELFLANGYTATTVPQIAERAGVTNRTFYRHFGDKQEVLFSPGNAFPQRVREIVHAAPAGATLRDALRFGMQTAVEQYFDDSADYLRRRWRIIHSEQSLVERDFGKQAQLTSAIRDGLIELGHDSLTAAAAAEIGVAALRLAQEMWAAESAPTPLIDHLRAAFGAMDAVYTQSGHGHSDTSAPT